MLPLGKAKNEPLFSHMDILLPLFHSDYHSNFKTLNKRLVHITPNRTQQSVPSGKYDMYEP